MKIERISENQIRCTLTSLDLSLRNLNLAELAYGDEKARGLFREMIQKASHEVGFDAEDIPLMVEAIPLSNESVMLVITKIEDPEELDTRFSKFTPQSEEDELSGSFVGELLEGADVLPEYWEKSIAGLTGHGALAGAVPATEAADPEHPDAAADTPKPYVIQTRIFRFDSLDQASAAAHVASPFCHGSNSLYKKPGTSQYYLVLRSEASDPLSFSRACNILSEYGDRVKQETASEAHYREHYEVIIREDALAKLSLL
ncbi:MAG: adaptor protein MecA [Clostridiales bacterium]|nr:adaptor protein MecA [Clostridiales bacterium]